MTVLTGVCKVAEVTDAERFKSLVVIEIDCYRVLLQSCEDPVHETSSCILRHAAFQPQGNTAMIGGRGESRQVTTSSLMIQPLTESTIRGNPGLALRGAKMLGKSTARCATAYCTCICKAGSSMRACTWTWTSRSPRRSSFVVGHCQRHAKIVSFAKTTLVLWSCNLQTGCYLQIQRKTHHHRHRNHDCHFHL